MKFIKKHLSFVLLLLATACFSSAQDKKLRSLQDAVHSWNKALVSPPSIDTLSMLTHDSVSYGHSGGLVEDKKAFLTKIGDGHSVFVTVKTVNETYKIIGKTAVVRHQLLAETNDKGKAPAQIKLGIMQVWVWEKGGWKMLARQAVKQ